MYQLDVPRGCPPLVSGYRVQECHKPENLTPNHLSLQEDSGQEGLWLVKPHLHCPVPAPELHVGFIHWLGTPKGGTVAVEIPITPL